MSVLGVSSSSLTAEAFPFLVSSLVSLSSLFFFLSLQFFPRQRSNPRHLQELDLTTAIFSQTHIYFSLGQSVCTGHQKGADFQTFNVDLKLSDLTWSTLS